MLEFNNNMEATTYLLMLEFGDKYENLKELFDKYRAPGRKRKRESFAGYRSVNSWAAVAANKAEKEFSKKIISPSSLASTAQLIFNPRSLIWQISRKPARREFIRKKYGVPYARGSDITFPEPMAKDYNPLVEKLLKRFLPVYETTFRDQIFNASFFNGWEFYIPSLDKTPNTDYDTPTTILTFDEVNRLKSIDLDYESTRDFVREIINPQPEKYMPATKTINNILKRWSAAYKIPKSELEKLVEILGIQSPLTGREMSIIDNRANHDSITLARKNHRKPHTVNNVYFEMRGINSAMNKHHTIESFKMLCQYLISSYDNSHK